MAFLPPFNLFLLLRQGGRDESTVCPLPIDLRLNCQVLTSELVLRGNFHSDLEVCVGDCLDMLDDSVARG